jgi:hypothetical protein
MLGVFVLCLTVGTKIMVVTDEAFVSDSDDGTDFAVIALDIKVSFVIGKPRIIDERFLNDLIQDDFDRR